MSANNVRVGPSLIMMGIGIKTAILDLEQIKDFLNEKANNETIELTYKRYRYQIEVLSEFKKNINDGLKTLGVAFDLKL